MENLDLRISKQDNDSIGVALDSRMLTFKQRYFQIGSCENPDDASEEGADPPSADPGSSKEAGLRMEVGDLVVSLCGVRLTDDAAMQKAQKAMGRSEIVPMRIWRQSMLSRVHLTAVSVAYQAAAEAIEYAAIADTEAMHIQVL